MDLELKPWGQYWILAHTETHKVIQVEVFPNQRLSYQYHDRRSEVWTIVRGIAKVTLEGVVESYFPRQVVHIPRGTKHRVENVVQGPLVFVEVQMGDYFGEDDIIRVEDDYDRI